MLRSAYELIYGETLLEHRECRELALAHAFASSELDFLHELDNEDSRKHKCRSAARIADSMVFSCHTSPVLVD